MGQETIKYVDYGTAYVLNKKIHINKLFRGMPKLHGFLLEHEMRHLRGEKHVDTMEQFNIHLFVFCLFHPSTWLQACPVWVHKDKSISIDKTKAYVWIASVLWGILLWWIIKLTI